MRHFLILLMAAGVLAFIFYAVRDCYRVWREVERCARG